MSTFGQFGCWLQVNTDASLTLMTDLHTSKAPIQNQSSSSTQYGGHNKQDKGRDTVACLVLLIYNTVHINQMPLHLTRRESRSLQLQIPLLWYKALLDCCRVLHQMTQEKRSSENDGWLVNSARGRPFEHTLVLSVVSSIWPPRTLMLSSEDV